MNNQMLSEKQLNFARIAIVCLDILKLPLQDTLNIFIKPKDLDTHINSCTSLCTGNTRLNPEQKKKCRNGPNGEPNYKQFDVTLCYKLIRNVCSLPEPQNKWGNKPNPTHQDISDDIERIREFRNRHFAHAECAEISDNEFNDLWKEAESIIKRCQIYTTANNGCRQDYEQMLKEINRTKLTFEEYTSVKERSSAIYIMGEEEVCYEKTAHFEAVVNLEEDYLLQVRWKKIDSHGCKKIDIDSTKYKGSNNRELFVHDLCKKDEARYRAVLSRSQNNKIYSNEVYLRVLGEKPFLEDLKVTSENNEVKIHYQFSVPVKSPNVTDIQWEKNGSSLDLKNSKYLGGSYKENFLIIKCPEEKDSGSYTCRVINAAGSVTKKTVLGIPSAIIEANKEIVFGSNNTLKGTITSCPSPVKVEWLYSVDGLTFLPIDINSTKHHGSSVDATSPKLLISDADLSHQQYYRISVKNLIGECTSNKMFLQVIGNRPFITSGRSCLIDGSINLSFNINVSEESPPVESVKWTKDGRELKIEKSGGKYSGGNVDDPSLTIDSVNENDAGIYRLKAINPVGDTESDEIILSTPDINFISNDKTDDGGVCIRMKVKSIPVPRCIKWSMKKNNSEPFQQINVNSPECKGTSHDFPCPVLVVKDKAILEKCSFKIEVQNAVGIGEITITDKMKSGQIHIEKMESGDVDDMKPGQILRTFYDGYGARFPFAKMIAKIANEFPPNKIGMLKTLIHSSYRIVEDKKAASAEEYFCFLEKENILTPTDVIPMQYILIGTECVELERICIEYAKKHRAMYFFEIPADNGYRNVHFHVVIDLQSLPHFRKEDERKVRETVANIVECKIDEVVVKGYLSSSSFFLVLSFKMIYVNKLLALKQQEKDELSKLRIDFFKVGSETVYVESLKDPTKLTNKHNTKYPNQQISLEKSDEPFSNEISEEYDLFMMSLQNYKSTRGTTNSVRVARMILGPCTGVLCALLTKEVTPSALMHNVKTFIAKYQKQKPCPINKDQQELVYGGNYSEFDITLLYILLRNVCTISPHTNNWGNDPNPGDRSVSANIERIRLIRNQCRHSSDTYLTDKEFKTKCQDIFTSIQELESYLGADTIYQDAMVHITTCSMDPEQEQKYINQLHDVNIKLNYVIEKVQTTKTASTPLYVRALYERDISKWKEEDSVFLETRNFLVTLNQVRQQPFVTIVGVPGSGKTATVRHIALILQKEGYEILPITDINKIEDYSSTNIPQVFVIDDVLGVFKLNDNDRNQIEKFSERLNDPVNPKTKTLMTCREAVFRHSSLSHCILAKKGNVVYLQNKENALNADDKQKLLEIYKLKKDLLGPRDLTLSSSMFPLLCKLFSNSEELSDYGSSFFVSPVPCILKEIDSLEKRNKHQYASLVLLMANENKLSEKWFDNENNETKKTLHERLFAEMKRNILEKCKVPLTTDSFQLCDALSEMEGTYTKKSGKEFVFIHENMLEIIAYHFGNRFPEFLLHYSSSDYVANNIKVENDNIKKRKRGVKNEEKTFKNRKPIEKCHESKKKFDLCIYLQNSKFPLLAERLFRDVQNEEFDNVFGNEALKNTFVLQNFIAVMEKTTYVNLHNVLLSEKIWNYEVEQIKNEKRMSLRRDARRCLLNEKCVDGEFKSNARGVAWAILFGHNTILQSLLRQMIQNKGNVDDIFQIGIKKCLQPNSNMNQNITGIEEMSLFDHNLIDEAFKKKYDISEYTKTDVDTKSDTEYCLNSGTSIDKYSYKGTDIDDDTNVDFDASVDTGSCTFIDTDSKIYSVTESGKDISTYNKKIRDNDSDTDDREKDKRQKETDTNPVIVEQCRLLCLACFSGDLNIVQTLLEHVNTDALNIWFRSSICLYYKNPLIIACEYGYPDIVTKLIEAGADVNSSFLDETPLTTACKNEQHNIVRVLLELGADVNYEDPLHKYTPLQYACQKGSTLSVEELIKAGADVNLSRHGETPLFVSSKNGHFSLVKRLILAGVDVNIKSKGTTPLIAACDNRHFKVMKLLMESGAKVDPNEKDKNTLHFTCHLDHLIIVNRLIEMEFSFHLNDTNKMSFIAVCNSGHLNVVKEMIKDGADVNMKDGDKTPLIVACYKDHVHVVKELIKAGADVNLRNDFISPLQVACYEGHLSIVKQLNKVVFDGSQISSVAKALIGACFFGRLSVVKELIACHFEVNLKHGKATPLTTTCFMGHLDIFKELIKAGAVVNLNNGCGTPLTNACHRKHVNIVRMLLKEGADVNQSDGNKTPLTAACEFGHWNVVEELIRAGADADQSDGNKTPLTAACEFGHCNVVEEMMRAGADVNQSDGNKTPLTAACEFGHCNVVDELIRAGADVNQSDGNKTPLTTACEFGHCNVVDELIRVGADVNQSDGNKTPLTAASEFKHRYIIHQVIAAGAKSMKAIGTEN